MMPILQLDRAGNPAAWVNHREAISMVACNQVIANLGEEEFLFLGGYNRISGLRSKVSVSSILLTKQRVISNRLSRDYSPPFSNQGLFARDNHLCLYCGNSFPAHKLTRDHIIPKSRGGDDSWLNSATSCTECNHAKGNRTPEEWGHLLQAVPYTPNYAEWLILRNRHILADQMAFLAVQCPKERRHKL